MHISLKSRMTIYTALMYSFPNLEPVHCSMAGSNCCFLTTQFHILTSYLMLTLDFLLSCDSPQHQEIFIKLISGHVTEAKPCSDFPLNKTYIISLGLKSSLPFSPVASLGQSCPYSLYFNTDHLLVSETLKIFSGWKHSCNLYLLPRMYS